MLLRVYSALQELVAVSAERVARLDFTTGQCLQAWSYDMMTSWSVNWTSEQVKVSIRPITATRHGPLRGL